MIPGRLGSSLASPSTGSHARTRPTGRSSLGTSTALRRLRPGSQTGELTEGGAFLRPIHVRTYVRIKLDREDGMTAAEGERLEALGDEIASLAAHNGGGDVSLARAGGRVRQERRVGGVG